VSYASHPNAFKNLLHSRIYGDQNEHYDRLLDYTNAETGAAFFAPSLTYIRTQAMTSSDNLDGS
jgi:putative iron-dependent peroxidase